MTRWYLGSIRTDTPDRKTTTQTRLYWDGLNIITRIKGKDTNTEMGNFNTFDNAAHAALTIWSGSTWSLIPSKAVRNMRTAKPLSKLFASIATHK